MYNSLFRRVLLRHLAILTRLAVIKSPYASSHRFAQHIDEKVTQAQVLLYALASSTSATRRQYSQYNPAALASPNAPLEKKHMVFSDLVTLVMTLAIRLRMQIQGTKAQPKMVANPTQALADINNFWVNFSIALLRMDTTSATGLVEDALEGAVPGQYTIRLQEASNRFPVDAHQRRKPLFTAVAKGARTRTRRPYRNATAAPTFNRRAMNSTSSPANSASIESTYCKNWNYGRECNLRPGETSCKRMHRCNVCRQEGHPATNCPQQRRN